jgi:hypothetical protein
MAVVVVTVVVVVMFIIVLAPTIDPNSGTYDYDALIEIESETPGAAIYYTTDGTDPDETDTEYAGPFPITSTTTVKAIATRTWDDDSSITSGTVTITAPPARFGVSDGTYIKCHGAQTVDGLRRCPDYKAMDGIYMLAYDDENDGDDEYIDIDIDADNDTFYVWARVTQMVYSRWDLRVDAGAYTTFTASSNDDVLTGWGWHWVAVSDYPLNGNHTIRLRRHAGDTQPSPKVDALWFTTDGGAEPPELYLIHPAGGERWAFWENQEITWDSSGDLTNVKIEYSVDSGDTWNTVIASTANDGSYTWTDVPVAELSTLRVRISDASNADVFDESLGDFSITATANPFDTSITLEDHLNHNIGLAPWDQGDRPTYLANLTAEGALEYSFSQQSNLYLGAGVPTPDHYPDTEAIDAYRTNNNDATVLIAYNNLYSIHSQANGESIMGSTTGHDDWFLYDELANRVENPANGRDNFDFGKQEFLDYYVERTLLHIDAGINGVFFDSFDILKKRGYENGYWDDGAPFRVQNPRTAATYTGEDWIDDFRYAVHYIRRKVDEYYDNRDVVFVANGLWREHVEEFGDLMDGFLREGYCGPSGTQATWPDWWFDRNRFECDVQGMALAEARGKYTIPMTGYVTGSPWSQSQNQGALYLAASVLMAIIGPDTKCYIRAQSGLATWAGWANLRLARFVPLCRYYKTGDDVYRRDFQHAIVFCNPTKVNQAGIALGDDYYEMEDNGTWSVGTTNTIDLDAGRGAILVLDKTWGD